MTSDQTPTHGVLDLPQNWGFLRDASHSFQPGPDNAWVSIQLVKQYGLVDGAEIIGLKSRSPKGWQLDEIQSICGLSPEAYKARTPFERLTAVNPSERIRLGDSGIPSMRIIDLVAPIGKGTRGLIVASPKTGKTQLLEEMAAAVRHNQPDIRIIVLLIDERPEEVTHFRRNVDAEVLASSSDQSMESHARLADITLAHTRCELECGRDIVILVDSLTRMARAFNQVGTNTRRTLSGGLDAKALEIPRRFFGLARNIENGGSVTVIATAMIDTGSRMDNYIFEEFKGTGNSEIVLDRNLAETRIFPAINIKASGTRKEELLFTSDELQWMTALRRRLVGMEPPDAMHHLINLIKTTDSNDELIISATKP